MGQALNKLKMFRSYLSDLKQMIYRKKINFDKTLNDSFDYQILPLTLRTFDRLSMSCSIESRMPFMDYNFVEFARKLPIEMKVSEIGSKSLLRELLKKYGNEEIYLNKQKIGFSSDIPSLFKDNDFKNFINKLVEEFDLKSHQSLKDKVYSSSVKNIGWENHTDLWKIASVSYYSNYNKLIKDFL